MSTEQVAAWPLSAAATAILMEDRHTRPGDMLRLTLKELVIRRVWTLQVDRRRGFLGRQKVARAIHPGPRHVPPLPPLVVLDRALRSAAARGGELTAVVRAATDGRDRLGKGIRDVAREELETRRLVVLERRRAVGLFPYTKVVPTPAAAAWQQAARGRMSGLRSADVATIAALGGLVLLLDPEPLADLNFALQRQREGDSGSTGGTGGDSSPAGGDDLDLDIGAGDLDSLGDLDSGFDAAVDAGGGDGGDGGGDGGGGGD